MALCWHVQAELLFASRFYQAGIQRTAVVTHPHAHCRLQGPDDKLPYALVGWGMWAVRTEAMANTT